LQLEFHKYQSTGNDFVIIDNRSKVFPHNITLISRLCDRHIGIGADGLILIENHPGLDFEMIYFNANGSQSLCGNGSLCAMHFAHLLGVGGLNAQFKTIGGVLKATVDGDQVQVKIKDQGIPETHDSFYFLNNGSPHHLSFVEQIKEVDVFERGREIRYSTPYSPDGTNVNFVEILGDNSLFVRTYERGVENETLSCGTGVVAAALAASAAKGITSPVTIETKGGNLQVKFEKTKNSGFENIWLIGLVQEVFHGEIQI